jgi:hypothetical protein
MNKKLYCINIQPLIGELWLDGDKNPIKFIDFFEAAFFSKYQFINETLQLNIKSLEIEVSDELGDKILDCTNDYEMVANLIKDKIDSLIEKTVDIP